MATTATNAGPVVSAGDSKALSWLTAWIRSHRRAATYIGVLLGIAAVLFAWNFITGRTAERSASRQISQGRLALESKNYPLAASVLSQVVENYSGTSAAEEGSILLAQVRLAQGDTKQAIDILQRAAPKADKYYGAQTYGLLGAALENARQTRDAAIAYETAADHALYPFLRAQFLSDAGRAWLAAGDTVKAVAAYRVIAEKLDSTSAAGEAKVRLGELTKGAAGLPTK